MKKVLISAVVSLALSSGAFAGDSVTITAPGGATQTIASSVIAAAITRTSGVTVTSITQVTPGGEISIVVGGNTYVVASRFIAVLLAYYS